MKEIKNEIIYNNKIYQEKLNIDKLSDQVRITYYELLKLTSTLGAFNFPYYNINFIDNKFVVTILYYPERSNLPETIEGFPIILNLIEKIDI